jgi:tRNA threonylcarbamoyladenosine biosynthesis protein TsaB
MNLLAIETATEACSAALLCGDAVRERFVIAPREHTQRLLGMVDELLNEAGISVRQLDGVAFGCGPGAFTGVRVAAAVAQGVAFAADRPVVGVSTLAALAHGAFAARQATHILAALDARMGEVYWGAYRHDGTVPHLLVPECVCRPEAVPVPTSAAWFGVGSGWDEYNAALTARSGASSTAWQGNVHPHAQDVLYLGRQALRAGHGGCAETALPVYLRDQVVQTQ